MGAHCTGELGPNNEMVGTPSPAAKCSGPVSPAMKTPARASTARNRASSGTGGKIFASGTSLFSSDTNACSRSPSAVVKTTCHPASVARRHNPAQCGSGHSFLGWLEATWQTTARSSGRIFFGNVGQQRIGADFGFQRRRRRDLPAGQKLRQSRGFVLWFRLRHRPVGIAKFATQKPAPAAPTQPSAGANKPADNRATVVARKIHRTIKPLTAQGAKHRPALAELRAPAPARHGPDPIEMWRMLEQRRDFLRHEQVQFAGGKMAAQGAERRRQQHGVAKVFELQGEDFFRHIRDCRRRGHESQFSDLESGPLASSPALDENCSSYSF